MHSSDFFNDRRGRRDFEDAEKAEMFPVEWETIERLDLVYDLDCLCNK